MAKERGFGRRTRPKISYRAETAYKGLSFSTYRSLALAFFDERERVKERDVGKRAKSTQPSSHSLCQKTEGKPSLPTGKIWHAVCNRSDLFLSMPLKEKKRLRMMGPMCQFSRLQLMKTNSGVDFRDVKLILHSLKKKNDPEHENKLAGKKVFEKAHLGQSAKANVN
jgi:hypothetical protein